MSRGCRCCDGGAMTISTCRRSTDTERDARTPTDLLLTAVAGRRPAAVPARRLPVRRPRLGRRRRRRHSTSWAPSPTGSCVVRVAAWTPRLARRRDTVRRRRRCGRQRGVRVQHHPGITRRASTSSTPRHRRDHQAARPVLPARVPARRGGPRSWIGGQRRARRRRRPGLAGGPHRQHRLAGRRRQRAAGAGIRAPRRPRDVRTSDVAVE